MTELNRSLGFWGQESAWAQTSVFVMISCIVLAFYLNANAVMTACIFLVVEIIVYYLKRKGRGIENNVDLT